MGKNIENLDKSAKFNIAKCPKFNLASAAKLTYNLASKFFKSHAKCYKKIASSPSTCKHHRSSKYQIASQPDGQPAKKIESEPFREQAR